MQRAQRHISSWTLRRIIDQNWYLPILRNEKTWDASKYKHIFDCRWRLSCITTEGFLHAHSSQTDKTIRQANGTLEEKSGVAIWCLESNLSPAWPDGLAPFPPGLSRQVQTFGVYIKILTKNPNFISMTSILFYLDSRLELSIYPALELSWHFNCSLARTICDIAHMQCHIYNRNPGTYPFAMKPERGRKKWGTKT